MKYNNKFTILALCILITSLISCGAGQSVVEKAEKARLLDEQIENLDFKFIANYAYPQNYQPIHLTSSYDVTITPDTIDAYLPYFGRSYKAPIDSSEGGIKFKSSDFEPEVKKGRKDGEWYVTIKTKDSSRPFTLYFHLWNNGTARLNITDQDRQPISFQGSVEENKTEK